MCVHANCLRKLFLGALMLESIPFIGNGSHSWQGCQLERYANVLYDGNYSGLRQVENLHKRAVYYILYC